MTLHWYQPPTPSADNLPAFLEHLHPIGVRWRDWASAPAVTYQHRDGELLAEVGAITVFADNQVVTVWPYQGIGHREQMVLAATAQRAFEQPPSERSGWTYTSQGRPRWTTYVLVVVDAAGEVGRMVARHQRRMTQEATVALRSAVFDCNDFDGEEERVGAA